MTFSSDDNRPMPQQPSGAVWTECDGCLRQAWCLDLYELDDGDPAGVMLCADTVTCERLQRRHRHRNPRYWLGWCRMRWAELVTYPREARRQQLPPIKHGIPPWARDGGEGR